MKLESYLQSTKARAVLERARRVAGTALSLHRHSEAGEQESRFRCGDCAAACAYVSKLPWGPQACRRSREKAVRAAFKRDRPVPFVCHMGFSCVSIGVSGRAQRRDALTFGPFCPAETPDALERDAIDGLRKIENCDRTELPFDLEDIPRVPADAVPAVAEWAAETLLEQAASPARVSREAEGGRQETGTALPTTAPRRKRARPVRDPYQAGDVAAALAADDRRQARAIVRALIIDAPARKNRLAGVRRGRALAVVASVIEAAERAGLETSGAWDRLTRFAEAASGMTDPGSLTREAMKLLVHLRPSRNAPGREPTRQTALNDLLDSRLTEGITLENAAQFLGERPSTLTRRLQRSFGMSFSEYAGRRRIDRAKQLLAETRLSVRDVARRVGLNDGSNLSKLFRKFEGMSPTEYRARCASPPRRERTGTRP